MLPSSIDLRPKHDDTSPRASHHSPSSSSSSSIFRATTIDCEQELLANNEQLNRNESHSEDAANITINEMKDNGCNDLRVFDGYFLYSVIRESKVSIADIVDEWLKSYVDDIKLSLLSLLQLIISSSNSRLVITKALYDNLTLNEIYKEITNNFVEDDIYPLIDQSIASFGSTLYEFIYKLSKSASFTFLLDDLIIPELFAFLKLCCNSNYRSLRHTATFIGLIFGNGLLHSMWNLAKNVSKQLDASIVSENNKISASLMSETDQNEQKKLKSYFSFVMNDIFCMRYRDVCHEIRTLCITMLGQWMKIYPQEIILDKNLKYIGWLLYDKQFNVRIQCLSVLIDQSVSLQSLNMIENFLKRFKDRLLQMTYDINNDVSLQAIKLFDKICKLKTYKTSEEDFKIICRNLRVNNRKIASGSAKLLLSINGFHNTKNLNRDSNFAIFNILASAIIDYQDFQSTLLFVDAFTEHISHILNSWDVYSDYLNDLSEKDDSLEELFIILMHASVNYLIGKNYPLSRPLKKSAQSEIEKSSIESSKSFTLSCFKPLVIIMDKYYAEMDKIELILKMMQYFDLEVIENMVDGQKNLEKIIDYLQELILNKDSHAIISCTITTLASFCRKHKVLTNNNDIEHKYIKIIVSHVKKMLADNVLKFSATKDGNMRVKEYGELRASIHNHLHIIKCLMTYFNLRAYDLFDIIDVIAGIIKDNKNKENWKLEFAIFECKTAYVLSLLNENLLIIDSNLNIDNTPDTQQQLNNLSLNHFSEEILMYCDLIIKYFAADISTKQHIICSFCSVFHELGKNSIKMQVLDNKILKSKLEEINGLFIEYLINCILKESTETPTNEAVNLNQEILIGYCTLLLYGIFPIDGFIHLLPYYGNNSQYSEILRHILSEMKANLPGKCSEIIASTIIDCFRRCLPSKTNGKFEKNSMKFIKLKELVRKISLIFGVNSMKFNNLILTIQKRVIDHFLDNCQFSSISKQDNNAYILESILPLLLKGTKSDKEIIFSYIAEKIGANFDSIINNWSSLAHYLMISPSKQSTKNEALSVSAINT